MNKSVSARAARTTGGGHYNGKSSFEEQGHSSMTDLDHRDSTHSNSADVFPGEKYVSRRSSKVAKSLKKKKKRESWTDEKKENRRSLRSGGSDDKDTEMVEFSTTKAQVAPHHYEDDSENSFNGILGNPYGDLYNYADTKYVKKKETSKDEQNSLLSTDPNKYHPDDPLVQGAYHDEFEDELHDIEVRDQLRNFHNFGEYVHDEDKKAARKSCCRRYWLPLACCSLVAVVVAGVSIGVANGRVKSGAKMMTVPIAPASLKASCSQYGIQGGAQLAAAKLCHDTCHQAECCWLNNSEYQCSKDSVSNCGDFANACSIINAYVGDEYQGDHADHLMDVPAAPSSLKLSCGRVKDAQTTQSTPDLQDLFNICMDECNLAECCWKKDTGAVCSDDSLANCAPYAENCDILNTLNGGDNSTATGDDVPVVEIPPAPQGLSAYCDPNGLKELGSGVCHAYCEPAACCWKEGIRSCYSEKTMCAEYINDCSPLNNLSNDGIGGTPETGSSITTAPPDHLESYCSEKGFEELGRGVCEMFCQEAECCWLQGAQACSFGNDQCGSYATACTVLNDGAYTPNGASPAFQPAATQTALPQTAAPLKPPVPVAPSGLQNYCSAQGIEDLGQSVCQNYCSKAECCWKVNVKSCAGEYGACSNYTEYCSVLNNMATSTTSSTAPNDAGSSATRAPVPLAPTDIDYTCSPTQLGNAEYGKVFAEECEATCAKAKCCWDQGASGVESCTDNINCQDYVDPCQGLVKYTTGTTTTSAPQSSSQTISGSGEISGQDTTTVPASSSSLPPPPDYLADICSSGKILDLQGFENCKTECSKAECCWTDDSSKECHGDSGCPGYTTPCAKMLDMSGISLPSSTPTPTAAATTTPPSSGTSSSETEQILNACNNKFAFFIKSRCEKACSAGACCYDDTIQCGAEVDCLIYQPCSILHRRNLRRE